MLMGIIHKLKKFLYELLTISETSMLSFNEDYYNIIAINNVTQCTDYSQHIRSKNHFRVSIAPLMCLNRNIC